MRAVLTRSVTEIEVVEVPTPVIGPGEILVAMKAVGLCGSDLTPWYVARKAPAVLGHETAGVVREVGEGVTTVRAGDRVFVHHHAPCLTCTSCRAGNTVMCPEWKPARLHPGGLAELVRVESATVKADTLKLPDSLGFDDGALIEPVACAVKAVARGEVRPGDRVAVIGLGSNGVLLGLVARKEGATLLLGSDPDPARRRLAERFGFDRLVDPVQESLGALSRSLTGGLGADVVFVIPTSESAFQEALFAAAPAGRVVLYSPVEPGREWRFCPHEAYERDLSVRFSYSCGPSETRRALELITAGVVNAGRLVTHRVPLSAAAEGFRLAARGGEVLKVLVEI